MVKKKNKKFYVNFLDKGNCEINPYPQEIHEKDLANALQKAAAVIPDDTDKIIVFSS